MCFSHPALLWLLWLAVPLVALAFHGARRKASAWRVLGGSGGGVLAALDFPKLIARQAMFTTSVVLLLLAAAGPELCRGLKPERRKGLDVIFMLDVSNSMLATDAASDRLSAAKSELLRISRKLVQGRKALLLFAGSPAVQCPLTGDGEDFEMLLDMASPDLIDPQGTDYRRAFEAALRLAEAGGEGRETVLVLVSDGEDHGDGLSDLASAMKRQGVGLHVIGVGSARPVPIPMPDGPKRDRQGRVVMTSFRPDLLAGLIKAADGKFWHSRPGAPCSGAVAADIAAEAAAAGWVMVPSSRVPVHRTLIAVALVLFAVASVTGDVRSSGRKRGDRGGDKNSHALAS